MRVVAEAAAAAATARKVVLKESRDEKRASSRTLQQEGSRGEKKMSFARAHTPKWGNLFVTEIALPGVEVCSVFLKNLQVSHSQHRQVCPYHRT